jgi:geranylgeranyl pyrophosphate synthase
LSARAAAYPEVLAAAGERVRAALARTEDVLAKQAAGYGTELERFTGATLAAGGKRLRPLLVLLCGLSDSSGPRADDVVRAGTAVELVHMATLVHDDVLDRAAVRRGHPTVFASDGRRAATASGDFLFSRAFHLLAQNEDAEQVRALSAACVDLARGELLQREDAFSVSVTEERYLRRCELKTASLFSAACRLGALASGRRSAEVEALEGFGRHLGVAFQLLDDVLDVAGTESSTGKQRGTDLLDGTRTLPLILAAGRDATLAGIDLRALARRDEAEALCDRIAATGALDEVIDRAGALADEAKAELDDAPPEPAGLLRMVADRVVDREAAA